MPDLVADGRAGEQRHDQGHLVGRDHPDRLRRADVQFGGNRGQGDVDDGAVEHDQHRREQHADQRPELPGFEGVASLGLRMGRCIAARRYRFHRKRQGMGGMMEREHGCKEQHRWTADGCIDFSMRLLNPRRFLQQRDLLAQLQDAILPATHAAEPGKGRGKCGIAPAAGDPGAVMQQAQGAQGFDKVFLAIVELAEHLVAAQQRRELTSHIGLVAREQHPQILNRGAAAAVIKVDEMRALVGPEQIARMAIAMQPDQRHVPGPRIGLAHGVKRLIDDGEPSGAQVFRQPAAVEQQVSRRHAEGLHIQRGAGLVDTRGANGMEPAERAAQPFQRLVLFDLWSAPALAREQGQPMSGDGMQGAAAQEQGWHNRHLALGQFQGEGVLFQNGRVAPAAGPVELGDALAAVFQTHLKYPVLVTVELQQRAVAAQAQAVDGVEHAIGAEIGIGERGRGVHAGGLAHATVCSVSSSTAIVAAALLSDTAPSCTRHCNCIVRSVRPPRAWLTSGGRRSTVRFFSRASLPAFCFHHTGQLLAWQTTTT